MNNKLPNDWQIKKLKDISDITSSKRIYEWEYVSSGIPFYRGKEITALKSKNKIENFIYISEVRYNELKEKYGVPNKGDILITAVGTIGNAYTIEDDKPFYFKDGNLLWIKNIKEYPKFVEYLFENNKKLFLYNSFGSSQHALTISKLENLSFYFPPLDEQKRIASGISKIDAYLENTIKLIEEKERFKKGIAKKLLTCKEGENVPEMRFKEFNDKWKTKTLISVANVKKGEQRNILDLIPNGKYPVLNGGMNFSGYYNSYNREANTITINEGGNAGYINFIKEKFWSSGHCYTLHDLKIDKNFLYQCLKNSEKRLMKLGHGTALKNIKISEIIEFTLDMPKSIEEQKIIGKYLSLLDAEIDNLKEQKEEIKKMKKGIINKLMSGEIRIVALGQDDELQDFSGIANSRFNLWRGRQIKKGITFSEEQDRFLEIIKDYIISNAYIENLNDIQEICYDEGGIFRAKELFDENLESLIEDIYLAMVS